jgi:hypothetical protein
MAYVDGAMKGKRWPRRGEGEDEGVCSCVIWMMEVLLSFEMLRADLLRVLQIPL